MRRLATIVFAALCFAAPAIVWSQTSAPVWYLLNAPEGSVITANGPITLRYGQVVSTCDIEMSSGPCSGVAPGSPSPEAWTAPQTFNPAPGSTTVTVIVSTTTFNDDPLPGVYKTVEIQEQSTVQNITVNGQQITVPALTTSSWYLLNAPDGSVITANGPITLRYGQVASTCVIGTSSGPCSGVAPGSPTPEAWSAPQTFSPAPGSTTVTVIVSTTTFNDDPLPGVYKTVEIQEQPTVQNITVNGQQITVPALTTLSICQLTATQTSITFPNTTVGYTDSSVASIANNCSTTITVTSVQILGPYTASGFATPFSLAPGQTLNYTAVFTPTTTGTATGGITFISNASTGQALSVQFSGSGVAVVIGQLSSNPNSINFNVAVNSTQSQSATITNVGAAAVTVSAVNITGTGFSLGSLTIPFTLAPNQSMPLTVIFSPTSPGSASGTLTVVNNAQNGTLTIPITGVGILHSVTLSWSEPGAQIVGYNMYRSTVSGGPYTRINNTLITSTAYTDQNVLGGATYFYTVTAVGTNGVESGYSNEATAAIPTP